MAVSAIGQRNRVEIKSVTKRNKKKKNDTFLAFWHRCKMTVTWLCATLDINMFILSRTARRCHYLTNSAFLSFFCGCQKSALIAILSTPSGSISFNSWLIRHRLMKIGQTVAEIWRFNGFSKVAAVRHLGFVGAY